MELITEKIEENGRKKTFRFLLGTDDGSDFKVKVPLRCKSVESAIDWLRPHGVPPDAIRQGEFFFVLEMPEDEFNGYVSDYSRRTVWHEKVTSIDNEGHHKGEILIVHIFGTTAFLGRKQVMTHDWTALPKVYARGKIIHPEHTEIDLGNVWHKVIPNKIHGPFRENRFGSD